MPYRVWANFFAHRRSKLLTFDSGAIFFQGLFFLISCALIATQFLVEIAHSIPLSPQSCVIPFHLISCRAFSVVSTPSALRTSSHVLMSSHLVSSLLNVSHIFQLFPALLTSPPLALPQLFSAHSQIISPLLWPDLLQNRIPALKPKKSNGF